MHWKQSCVNQDALASVENKVSVRDRPQLRARRQALRGVLLTLLSTLNKTTSIVSLDEKETGEISVPSKLTTMERPSKSDQRLTLLSLPAEIRTTILEYVFNTNIQAKGFLGHGLLGGIFHDEEYRASDFLTPLLVCKQFYQDSSLLALNWTHFIIANLFSSIPQSIQTLHPKQIEAIRSIAFVADARHFRKLHDWGHYPFGIPNLKLDTLTIILKRSSNWHYLFDFTSDIVRLLRNLSNVKKFVFVRNVALVKGSFKTWYNRLIGLILKIDHSERYDKTPSNPEKTWWSWSYDEVAQSFTLEAKPAKMLVDEETYMQQILPLMEELRVSMESEEWNPDPRARLPYY